MKLANPLAAHAAFTFIALALGNFACADKANPVMPSSTPIIPGGRVGGAHDAAVSEAGTAADAALVGPADDAGSAICDLLAQTGCPSNQACYPTSGIGRCSKIGIGQAFTACLANSDCDRGLACITTCGLNSECQPICDVTATLASTNCATSQSCKAIDSTGKVGVCRTEC